MHPGALTIDTQAGATGSDMIIIDDSGSQGPYQYRATATTITRVGGPTITTLNYKNRLLKAAVGGSITQIVSNSTGTTLTVDGGVGANTFDVAATATRLTTCRGRWFLMRAAGGDTVQFNDQGHGGNETYLVEGGTLNCRTPVRLQRRLQRDGRHRAG